jgi:hypothetical protein
MVAVQIFATALRGAKRPHPPSDCQRCGGEQKLHAHGSYERFAEPSGQTRIRVQRFVCPRCRRTFGLIPAGMFPYRSLGVEQFEAWMDATSCRSEDPGQAEGSRAPPGPVAEQGCMLRARQRLRQRIPVLCGLLGQLMPRAAEVDLSSFWQALRNIAPLAMMLVHLAEKFKTSLLGDYLSLRPPW